MSKVLFTEMCVGFFVGFFVVWVISQVYDYLVWKKIDKQIKETQKKVQDIRRSMESKKEGEQ